MSDWYWKVIILKTAFVLTCFVSYLRADDNVQKLPFCNPSNGKDGPVDDLMIVSTLDGKLTAFSTEHGIEAWAVQTQPLLSSTLHNLELTSGGKWVRLVPSLSGTLYSLSGDTIEPLPFDAEQLLSSSYKYTDDLVIAGARETVWAGIDSVSGEVIYECNTRGCNSEQRARSSARDVLVLRRHSHTVRALDPRQGSEKWNFSVAEHQLAVSPGSCGARGGPAPAVALALALHDGRVALRSRTDYRLLWQRKLDAPVASMWRLHGGSLQTIDVVWEATQSISAGLTQQPSLYIGVHNTQLYIQESPFYTKKLETAVSVSPVPWKLLSARPMLESLDADTALTVADGDNALAQLAHYGSKGLVDDYGVFLYLQQETCDQAVQATETDIDAAGASERDNASDDEAHDHHHIHVHVYSLWFWWKEVLLIAVTSALLMNLMIWPRFFAPKLPPLEVKTPQLSRDDFVHFDRIPEHFLATHRVAITHIDPTPQLPAPDRSPPVPEYSGRYETDFTPLRCLGRGGFGVVFEVRNNIDHCNYALKRITLPQKNNIDHCNYAFKRITLPQKETKRERVRREVRALAKLDHVNIVRYFNAWEERPPPPHTQMRDQALIRELDSQSLLSDEYSSTPFSSPAKSPNKGKGDSVFLNLNANKPFDTGLLDYNKLQELSKRNRANVHQAGQRWRPPDGKRSLPSVLDDVTLDVADKHNPSLSCSDSIVFDSGAPAEGQSTRGSRDLSHEPRLSRRNDNTNASSTTHKKKGHTRHWSLDACVKSNPEEEALAPMFLYIQMQLCRPDSLHDWLRDNRAHRDINEIKSLFRQIVSAVEYVHAAGLIHRDLKPSNILFSQEGLVKVGDFGLVTSMVDTSQDGEAPQVLDVHQRHTYKVGTHLYMSPEQIQCRPYNLKVDIYSLGLILFELLQPFGTESERVRCLEDVKKSHYPQGFKHKYPDQTSAIESMLNGEPSKRPTAIEVNNLPWLQSQQSQSSPHLATIDRYPLWGNNIPTQHKCPEGTEMCCCIDEPKEHRCPKGIHTELCQCLEEIPPNFLLFRNSKGDGK